MKGNIVMAASAAAMLLGSWALAQTLPGNAKNGVIIYRQHCIRCHGQAGDGLGTDMKDLVVPPANFQSLKSRSKTDMELLLAIKQGVLFSPMHGWADRLTEQEMLDVLNYLRSLAPFNPIG
jgi:mono/diheme cytochrome c family protein